jgi:cell division protein FtsB
MNSIEPNFGERDNNASISTRVKVGKPGEIELIEPESRQRNLPLRPRINKSKNSKSNSFLSTLADLSINKIFKSFIKLDLLSQALLVIFLVGILRLVLMQEGMLDIRRKAAILTEQKLQNDHLENENLALKKEISKIKNDQRYQRRLAREHLGVIGKGEYLILFSKEGDSPK